jgi:cbb3-type cytochrome oxidase subunit 3
VSLSLKRIALLLIVTALLLIAFLVYNFRSGRRLNVDPHSREVIEKAKRR